jgi:GTP-binding protein
MNLKNIAVVAHVDHGKTTLVDELLKQSGVYSAHEEITERVMDSGDIERERGITITAKNCAINWNDVKINLLDTPGHADFGGEVERSLMMVDGILLLVDASEGPLPQTRFVLSKAIKQGLKIAVFINKIDRHDERHEEVCSEVEDLLLELVSYEEIDDYDIDIPIFYGSGRDGYVSMDPSRREGNLESLLDFMTGDYYPSPNYDKEASLQILVSNLSYSKYLGQLVIGRITRGTIEANKPVVWIGRDKPKQTKVSTIEIYEGLGQKKVESAEAGEIVILSGVNDALIGDTIAGVVNPEALERIEVEPPTVSVEVSVSTCPFSGKEGEYLTSRRLEDFLKDACRKNVSLKYAPTEDPKVFVLKARGELQVAIVFEEIRRAGFELMIARPKVLMKKDEDGKNLEPYEKVIIDVPDNFTGVITEKLSKRFGRMEMMSPIGDGRTRLEFKIPSRGLIGYRSTFLTDTKGEGLMSSLFLGYEAWAGKMLSRQNGALISDRQGKTTAYALFKLLSTGQQFVNPGEEVYEGMVVGECKKVNEQVLNVCRGKHLTSIRTAGTDENPVFPAIPVRTLEWALDWIDDDEWVEVTPINIRIRKKILKTGDRSVIR